MYQWQQEYKKKTCSLEEALHLIDSEDRVAFGHCAAEPQAILKGMKEKPEIFGKVINDHAQNFADMTPCHFYEAQKWIRNGIWNTDVLLTTVSPPDKRGFVSCGVSVDFTHELIDRAKKVIVQVNKNMPYTYGDTLIHISKLDAIIEADMSLPLLSPLTANDKEETIGRFCASLIPDGATISIGLGTICDAVCRSLHNKKDLGIHSDMFSDSIMDLYEDGVITNNLKSIDKGKMIVSFVMGTKKLYEFVERNPVVVFKDAEYTNNPIIVAQNARMVYINTSEFVDFMGQVVCEKKGLCRFNGSGVLAGMMRGVSMAYDRQGKGIIAMTASGTDDSGKPFSRIRAYNPEGSDVSLVREDADYFVTEYGIAHLKGKPLSERARALISIADPIFRDELKEAYEKRFLRSY